MRRLFLLLGAVLLWPVTSWAQCPGVTGQLVAFAAEQLLVADIPLPLTASVYKPTGVTPSMATISVEGGAIRYRVVGIPTATDGHPTSGTFSICGFDTIAAFKAVRIATDALLTITYYKPK